MVERIKNKKGFTIIEIMVVIALIGILAAVLVPQFGGVRDRAKDTGVLTNVKMVEAYVASIIDSYKPAGADTMDTAIETQFTGTALTNPYDGATTISVTVDNDGAYVPSTGAAANAGIVNVLIDSDNLDVYINGFDSKGNVIEASKRTIKK